MFLNVYFIASLKGIREAYNIDNFHIGANLNSFPQALKALKVIRMKKT